MAGPSESLDAPLQSNHQTLPSSHNPLRLIVVIHNPANLDRLYTGDKDERHYSYYLINPQFPQVQKFQMMLTYNSSQTCRVHVVEFHTIHAKNVQEKQGCKKRVF